MRAYLLGAATSVLLTSACSATSCPDVGSIPELDAGSDVLLDAPADVPGPDACAPLRPGGLGFAFGYSAFGAADSRPCLGSLRFRVYRPDGTLLHITPDDAMSCTNGVPSLGAGDYDVVVDRYDDPRWVAGAAILRPEHCAGLSPQPPYCPPIRVHIEPCEVREVMPILFCDPFEGECPTGFPWESPAP